MKGIITVILKQDILDPQGRAVMGSLKGLGFGEVQDVRIGKSIEVVLDELCVDEADSRLRRMYARMHKTPERLCCIKV